MNTRTLTTGQRGVLSAAAAVMVAVGVAGAVGTYSNAVTEFGRQATAAGVVAAGEGLTLILALTMVGLTLLGQSAPAWVRIGLWLAPLGACGTGLALADNLTEAVVYGATPLGMSGAAEGLGLIARRIVIYTTGVDAEAQRRNAATLQRLAYHRARSANHPGKWTRLRSERTAWRLARHAGRGDAHLGTDLVDVQRTRLTEAGDAALLDMFTVASGPTVPELPPVTLERLDDQVPAVEAPRPRPEVVPAGARLLPIVARPVVLAPTGQDAQDAQDAPASPSVPPFPLPVPAGVRLLPIVARPQPADVTTDGPLLRTYLDGVTDRYTSAAKPAKAVVPPLPEGVFSSTTEGTDLNIKATTSVPAETTREVVTEVIALTPAELRRRARKLNRQLVAETNRPVTIDRLRQEFGLSRREAAELRREVVITALFTGEGGQ